MDGGRDAPPYPPDEHAHQRELYVSFIKQTDTAVNPLHNIISCPHLLPHSLSRILSQIWHNTPVLLLNSIPIKTRLTWTSFQ